MGHPLRGHDASDRRAHHSGKQRTRADQGERFAQSQVLYLPRCPARRQSQPTAQSHASHPSLTGIKDGTGLSGSTQ